MTYKEYSDLIAKDRVKIQKLYFKDDLTAKELAKVLGIEFNNNFQKVLLREYGKKTEGASKGGARKNSGNKAGVQFCPNCGKKWMPGHTC